MNYFGLFFILGLGIGVNCWVDWQKEVEHKLLSGGKLNGGAIIEISNSSIIAFSPVHLVF